MYTYPLILDILLYHPTSKQHFWQAGFAAASRLIQLSAPVETAFVDSWTWRGWLKAHFWPSKALISFRCDVSYARDTYYSG